MGLISHDELWGTVGRYAIVLETEYQWVRDLFSCTKVSKGTGGLEGQMWFLFYTWRFELPSRLHLDTLIWISIVQLFVR